MTNNPKSLNTLKWAGFIIILLAVVVSKHVNSFSLWERPIGLVGFSLLLLYNVLHLRNYLKATKGTGERKKGVVIYLVALVALFGLFDLYLLALIIGDQR